MMSAWALLLTLDVHELFSRQILTACGARARLI